MVTSIAGAHACGSCELGDSDMVGVAVCAFWTERDDHVGPNAPDVLDECRHSDCRIDLVNPSVGVAQDGDTLDTEHRGGGPQFPLTKAADFGLLDFFAH
ncbi:MAG TPA: hypothetical protein VL127_00240 [Bryobacteraceae bacterium]|nr:hypothetical protein [Bryobacteraceae bacterium]